MKKLFLILLIALSLTPLICKADSWIRLTDFPGIPRRAAFGFAIGNKGYIGGGFGNGPTNDLWEYDPATDKWTQKSNPPFIGRYGNIAFGIGSHGYLLSDSTNQLWEYSPNTDSWLRKANLPGVRRELLSYFVLGNKAYVGAGLQYGTSSVLQSFFCYDPVTDIWTPIADNPYPFAYATGFTANNKGYFAGCYVSIPPTFVCSPMVIEYDPQVNLWAQKSNFVGDVRTDACAFNIGNNTYFGTGDPGNGGIYKDWWQYYPISDSWIEKSSIPSVNGKDENPCFVINCKGYICFGSDLYLNSELWEYTPDNGTGCMEATYICDSIKMPDTLKVCENNTVTFPAVVTSSCPILNTLWMPSVGLDDATLVNPTLAANASSGWYTLSASTIKAESSVFNGNFSTGYLGFNSDYSFAFSGPGALMSGGRYTITTDPRTDDSVTALSFGDHTTDTGSMMAVNGTAGPANVWCENIIVTPNTNYVFSAWFANWSSDTTNSIPIIQFEINDTLVGKTFSLDTSGGVWTKFFTTWNTGNNSRIRICITDQQRAVTGHDFAIDDIAFQQLSTISDSMYVEHSSCPLEIIIHNALTPNGDGINDTWVIEGLYAYDANTVQVYNKWGDRVYEKMNYNNDWNGGSLPDGTYFYLVRLNAPSQQGRKNEWTGSLLIKR